MTSADQAVAQPLDLSHNKRDGPSRPDPFEIAGDSALEHRNSQLYSLRSPSRQLLTDPRPVVKATATDTQCHTITQKPIGRLTEHFPTIVPEFLIDFRVRRPRPAERRSRIYSTWLQAHKRRCSSCSSIAVDGNIGSSIDQFLHLRMHVLSLCGFSVVLGLEKQRLQASPA